jgi:Tfp pilus assembly protein PilN
MDVKTFFARLSKADFADAVGVALGVDGAALALVRKRFNRVVVVACESLPLEGDAGQRWAGLAETVRNFAARHAPDGARISVALERRAALLAHMQLPAAAADNLDKVVAYETDRLIPLPAESVYTVQHARPLGAANDRLAVTVVAAAKEAVEAASTALAAVGAAPSAVSVVPVALNDYYAFCRGDGAGTAAIFHVDGGREYLTLTTDGVLVNSVRYDPREGPRGDRVEREMESMLLERREERPELIIDEPQAGEGELGLAAIAPPDFLPGGLRPSWLEAAAIGAALAQLNEARVRMNLLPSAMARAEEGIGLRELALSAVVAVFALTLGVSIAVKNLSIRSALAAEVDRLLPKVTSVTKKEEQNRALLAKLQTLEKSKAVSVLAYLRDMTTRIPPGAYLTTFRYKGDRIEIDGIADNAAGLIALLEQSQYFKNVEFTAPTTKYLQDQERFSLRMELEQ